MRDDSKINLDNEVVANLARTTGKITTLLDQILSKHDVQNRDLEHFRRELRTVRDSIRNIARVLHEGNGQKPLISRVAVIEERLNDLRDDLTGLETSITSKEKTRAQIKVAERKGKYAIAAAITSGALGFLASIAALLFGN